MKPGFAVRFLELAKRYVAEPLAVLLLFFACISLTFVVGQLFAAGGQINPNGAGNTTQGTRTTCATAANYDCINDAVSSTSIPSTVGDYITFARSQFDSYQLDTVANVSSVSQIEVFMYHAEGNTGHQFQVSLWDSAETTEIGTTQDLSIRTTSQWDSVIFSGLSLNQATLDGLRVRTTCTRPGGGNSTCTNYALYAHVTYTPAVNVTVSSTGSQKNLNVGTSTAHIGGAFAITENTSSRNITSITINETGTIDAQTDIDNIKLLYEMDAVAPYDCASVAYNGNELQFGSTDTDGFSGADGSATFTGSVGITTTSAMCVYPVLDVGTNASAGETIEIQITNPSTDVIGDGSSVIEPSTAITLSGTTNIQNVELRQMHYHWRNDDGTEGGGTPATSASGGTEDTPLGGISQLSGKRIRIGISNEGNITSGGVQYRLEYAQKVTSCSAATGWTDVAGSGGDWDMDSSSQLVEGDDTTDIVIGTGGVTNENTTLLTPNGGQRESTSETASLILTSSQFVELEYAVEPTVNASEGSTYCFRLTNGGMDLDGYDVYPEASISSDVSVSVAGSQTASVTIPDTDVYAGGVFVITDETGVHTISAITIHASGTVDYQNDIDNVRLFYDTDAVAPYDCASATYDGNEIQFGATDSDGFSAGATSTFSDSVQASTTQSICLYVVYDVSTNTANNETLDIRFNNPSSDIVINSGSISPASQLGLPGVTTFVKSDPTQIRYHWRLNDESEALASSATGGSENTPLTALGKQTNIRLRIEVSNEGGETTSAIQYRLEYAQKVSTCDAATGWTDVGQTGGDFDMGNTTNLTDGSDTTNISTGVGGVTDENTTFLTPNGGQKDTSSQTGAITLAGTEFIELEYSIRATSSISSGSTYCFRLTNAGTPLDSYDVYPEATIKLDTDFFVQRGISTITGASLTLTAGVDYEQPSASSSAFIRITNTHHTGAGDNIGTGNQNADDVTVYILNPSNIRNSITFQRAALPSGNTRVAWEILEYRGSPGGENEMIVRQQSAATYTTTGTTVNTPTVTGVTDDTDVVVFITAQHNPDAGRNNYNAGLSIAAWNPGTDTATFTRGDTGSDAVVVSYAVVEFTGSNWKVQRSEHTYTNAGATETESITAVNSLSRAFVHAQKRVGSGLNAHEDYGHEVWLSSIGQLSFLLDSGANTPGGHTSVAWVIENTQTQGDTMLVTRSNGTQSGGTAPLTANINIGATLADLSASSIFMNNRSDGTATSWPEPMISTRLISTTQYEIWVSNTGDIRNYRTEVVEWPTARRKISQNYYRLYVDNDALDPTDPWPLGASDLGENTEMTGFDEPIGNAESIRIRMTIVPSGAAMPSGVDAFRLQYAPRTTTCSAVSNWQYLGDIGSTTALWRGHAGTPADGTALSSDPPAGGALNISVSDIAGTYEEENSSALTPYLALVGEDVEFDWTIENNGAAEKTDYCFRMVEADGTQFLSYNFYPVIRTVGYGAQSQDWRWYDDAENETPVDGLAATNSAPIDVTLDNTIQLRITLREVNGGSEPNTKFRLQFSEYSTFSTSTDVADIGSCTENSYWCYADGGGIDNATVTSRTLGDADSCVGAGGAGCGTHNESGTTTGTLLHSAGEAKEFAFTIRHAGARVNRVYYFRLFDVANGEQVVLGQGESYPSLVTEGASLTFEIMGVGADVGTESITTDVLSTPTTIAYGEVNVGSELEAAHRLRVSTNATEGYQILMYSGQEFLNGFGTEIQPIAGTNATPSAWDSGCIDSCFGYHTGDDTLGSGLSTRFSAPDTYARFSTSTPEEVAHSSIPVESEITDVVYRLRVDQLQETGQYETDVVFIAVPIF